MFRGTLIAQIIAIIGAIFLAKIYGEEAYGFLGVFISIISIFSIISTFQLDKCIIIAKDKKESINWFNFLLIVVPITSIFSAFILLIISTIFFDKNIETPIIILATIGAIFFTINLINESLFTFKKEFSIISNARIFLTISNVCFQILLYKYYNLYGLIIGFLTSQLFLLTYYLFKNRLSFSKPNALKIKAGIKYNNY